MPRAKKTRTRDLILDATVEALSRHGIDKVSLQMIADRVGVSQTAVLHHFKNKDELVEAAIMRGVHHCREMLAAKLSPELDARERLDLYGAVNIHWAFRFRHEAQLVIMLYYLSVVEERFSRLYSAIREGAQERVREFLCAGRREGLFRFDDDQRVHELLHEALMGSIVNALSAGPGAVPETRLRRKWQLAIERLTGGGETR